MDKRTSLLKLIRLNSENFLSGIKYNIGNGYVKFKDRLEQNTKNLLDVDFEDLAPVDEIENGDEYFKALDWALKDKKIYNIALAGPYGSGKSSVIHAYLKKHPSMKVINLSLASFFEEKKDNDGNIQRSLVAIGEEKIEEGILKQLFYKVNYKKIPQSRYRKLHNVSGIRIFRNLVILILIAAGTVTFFNPYIIEDVMDVISNTGNLLGIGTIVASIVAVVIVGVVLGVFSYFFWWISSKYKVKELNLADKTTITVNEENNESVFNKNMDEIVYFFEATNFDTVFIEDLDRFQSAEIFIKLRELNTILNNYEMIKRRLVFVYAIKDDMFIDKDRTKFFDFIIPVIPIINSTNSGEILLKRLKSDEDKDGKDIFKYDISPKYVTQISPYIDDMRVLTNVYNEFVIYKNTLSTKQGLKLFDETMMSLIIFKNLYPKDFADLQLEEGIVKMALGSKKDFIIEKTKSLQNEMEMAVQTLESIKKEILSGIKELKAAMLYYMAGGLGPVKLISVNSITYQFSTIMQENFDMNILNSARIGVCYYNIHGNTENRTLDNIDTITEVSGNKFGYIDRCQYLEDSIPERQDEIKRRIQELENQIHDIKASSLQKLIEMNDIDKVLPEVVRKNKLLVFLLRNGYIDETYANYMNYFHPNSITKDDMNFILSLRNHEALEYTYTLTKRGQIVERLLDYDYEQKEIYNFDLLEFLLQISPVNKQCRIFIKQLADEKDSSWQFINEFVDKTKKQDLFIELLGSAWPRMWNYIHLNTTLTEDRKTFYFKLILINVKIDQIEKMDFASDINQFMTDNDDILKRLSEVNISSIKAVIDRIHIVFRKLECDGISEELLEYIFVNNHYEINMAMLRNIIKMKQPNVVQHLFNSNYTVLRNLGYQPLLEYIDMNFKDYMTNIVLAVESNTNEAIETVLCSIEKIMNDAEMCSALIEKEDIILQDFKECFFEKIGESKELDVCVKFVWDTFLVTDKVVVLWSNVMIYWQQFGLSRELLKYIEKNMDMLLVSYDSELVTDEFIKSVIAENMDLIIYRKFILKFKVTEFTNAFSEFSEENMKLLLEYSYFELTPERYIEMKEVYPDLRIDFLLQNKEVFLNNLAEYSLVVTEVEDLVNSTDTTEEESIAIISTLDISALTVEIARIIKSMQISVEKTIVERAWILLPKKECYELFLHQIKVYTSEEIAKKFAEFGGVYAPFADRTKKHKVTLHNGTDHYNDRLMRYLDSIDYLTSIEHHTNKSYDAVKETDIEENIISGWIKKA